MVTTSRAIKMPHVCFMKGFLHRQWLFVRVRMPSSTGYSFGSCSLEKSTVKTLSVFTTLREKNSDHSPDLNPQPMVS